MVHSRSPTCCPAMVRFGLPKPAGHGYLHKADSDLMHHQYRPPILQWNPGPARSNPTQIIAATCGRFHAVILQEGSDHVPHVSDQLIAYTGDTDLAILLNRDTWGMVVLAVRELLRRPSPSGNPTVTFCSVHLHTLVAKKRYAFTDFLRRLHAHMTQHSGDFTNGDSNMSAFSTVGDVFADPEFSAPGNSFLWGLGALEDSDRECTGCGFTWLLQVQPCRSGAGPRDTTAHFPVFLHLHTTNFPGPDSMTRSHQARQRRLERKATKHDRPQCRRKLTQPPAH